MSIDFEVNYLYSNAVGVANENTGYQTMNYECDNTRSTRNKKLEEEAKQELLKEKQNKRECQCEMEISRLEQLGKKKQKQYELSHFQQQAKQAQKQSKRECQYEMEISQLEQLDKKSRNYLSNKSAEQSYLIVLKNMNYLISSNKPTKQN